MLVVAGSGRSGTSLFTGLTGRLGVHIPKPEVSANRSNPRGFGEPRWLVDFHNDLLSSVDVVDRGRPPRGLGPHRQGRRARPRRSTSSSRGSRSSSPRTSGSWSRTRGWRGSSSSTGRPPAEVGADVHVATMLRHPAEVMRSREIAYGTKTNNTTRVVGWMTMMLGTELRTRDLPRATVRYDDLLADWQAGDDAGRRRRSGWGSSTGRPPSRSPTRATSSTRRCAAPPPTGTSSSCPPRVLDLRPAPTTPTAGWSAYPPTSRARRGPSSTRSRTSSSAYYDESLRRRPHPHRRHRAAREAQGRTPGPRGDAARLRRQAASARCAGPCAASCGGRS